MSSEWAIQASGLGKRYALFDRPSDRLRQLIWGERKAIGREFWALRDAEFEIARGEVVGIVGRNGAGKSTLLQMVCGTLSPTEGKLQVNGRVAALLELGAGFNPDFSGIENVYMNAALMGLSRAQVDHKLDSILAFADIGEFARQPVKTYSSGMFVRLAFAVATSVEPDILVIDEALSVGDGAFARKSFDRIMGLKDAGATILFCSHSMYQVEALCQRALWLESGRVRQIGPAAEVTMAYGASLNAPAESQAIARSAAENSAADPSYLELQAEGGPGLQTGSGTARITRISASAPGTADGQPAQQGSTLALRSCESDLHIQVAFEIDPELPSPGVALDESGRGVAQVLFERIPLLKGTYYVTVFLSTEDGVQPYEQVERALTLHITQQGLEQGLVSLPHRWIT
jgi:lipopolysaccharide transport system ATP-binding protein